MSLEARDTTEVHEAFAIAIAQLLGWELFGAFALRAAGIDGDPAQHRDAVHPNHRPLHAHCQGAPRRPLLKRRPEDVGAVDVYLEATCRDHH